MQDNRETEPDVCMHVKPKKIYVYDRTRTKVCCFCGISIRYDCLARHNLTKKCTIIKDIFKDQLAKVEAGQKVIIPDVDTNERINKKRLKTLLRRREIEKRNRLSLNCC